MFDLRKKVSKWSLRKKLFGLCLLFVFPIIFLLYATVSAYNKDIDFARMEMVGNSYLRSLMGVMEHLTYHKLSAEFDLSHQASISDKTFSIEKEIDKAIEFALNVDSNIDMDLQFTDQGLSQRKRDLARINFVKSDWEQLKSEITKISAQESNKKHQDMMDKIKIMMAHAGDTSNLILDPDLDSYYLMDVILIALPSSLDRMHQIHSMIRNNIQDQTITLNEKINSAVMASMLKISDRDRVIADNQTVVYENSNFNGPNNKVLLELPKKTDEYSSSLDIHLKFLSSLSKDGKIPKEIKDYENSSLLSLKESYAFWNFLSELLDELLQTRIDSYSKKKYKALLYSLMMLIFLLISGFFIIKNISLSLDKGVKELELESHKTYQNSIMMASSSEKLSSTCTEQAASIQESISAVVEISSMIKKTAEQASLSTLTANSVVEKTKEGLNIMNKMANAMKSIDESNIQLESLIKIIEEISEKTNVINDIVLKTRILSFNASIEAARSGQYGRGFAVVAEEVGSLAQMSGNAAQEIRDLLNISEQETKNIVLNTQNKVKDGISVNDHAQFIFHEISEKILSITEQAENVNVATQEQKSGIDQINITMNEMDQWTRENSRSADQTEDLSKNLKNQSENLKHIANRMNMLINGVS